MSHYIGIDLGTTNSAICTWDGQAIRLYKSPEQNDVTPSAIYIDKRGRYYGSRAYRMTAFQPDRTATKFKRLIGSSTPINLHGAGVTLTPDECSSEILKVLYGYLPEEIRSDETVGTVVTVPAAFDQLQRDATLKAADAAGIGKVALMQEPVAAVMTAMRINPSDGIFLVYDIGGGTFDVAIAQSISGSVSLLGHGGISMCGGADFDRLLLDNIAIPWLMDNFKLSENFRADKRYASLARVALWACEHAKIELSNREDATIFFGDSEINRQDNDGNDIFIDIPLDRPTLDNLIRRRILDTVASVRETLEYAQISMQNIQRIVFIGGPTQYKPLRDFVCAELGMNRKTIDTSLNPMTAVAEGAAIFAESIDWSQESRCRKSSHGSLAGHQLDFSFEYESRTTQSKARIMVKCGGDVSAEYTFQIDSLDTGWSSGRIKLLYGANLTLTLPNAGENTFKVFVFDQNGAPVSLGAERIVITRTAVSVDGIPASHSLGVAVRESPLSSGFKLYHFVKKGEMLPKKGQEKFKTTESLRAGGEGAIYFNIYEGEIEDPYDDNRLVGCVAITGRDFDAAVIRPGEGLLFDYEVADSGRLSVSISAPLLGITFANKDYYSRGLGNDFLLIEDKVKSDSVVLYNRIQEIERKINCRDSILVEARNKLDEALELIETQQDEDAGRQAVDYVYESRKKIAEAKDKYRKPIRNGDLDGIRQYFENDVHVYASQLEITEFENMACAAENSINKNTREFEDQLDSMWRLCSRILWFNHDGFVVARFNYLRDRGMQSLDNSKFRQLVQSGEDALIRGAIDDLRKVVFDIWDIMPPYECTDDIAGKINIIRG